LPGSPMAADHVTAAAASCGKTLRTNSPMIVSRSELAGCWVSHWLAAGASPRPQ
jgi:hypothetical protein